MTREQHIVMCRAKVTMVEIMEERYEKNDVQGWGALSVESVTVEHGFYS